MTTNFLFKRFHNSTTNWHVHTAHFGRIGSVGQFWVDGKRQGFEATKPVRDAEGHITGFVTIGTGFINRSAAANALLEAL